MKPLVFLTAILLSPALASWSTLALAQNPPPEPTLLQTSTSPQGIQIEILFQEGQPVKLLAKNHMGDTLWQKNPGDEANLRITWNQTGTLLFLVTNNQETDRDFWTPREKAQNHLFLIDPRDGTLLQDCDLDTAVFQLDTTELPESTPRKHKFTQSEDKISVSTEKKEENIEASFLLSKQTLQELKRPKITQTRTGITWE